MRLFVSDGTGLGDLVGLGQGVRRRRAGWHVDDEQVVQRCHHLWAGALVFALDWLCVVEFGVVQDQAAILLNREDVDKSMVHTQVFERIKLSSVRGLTIRRVVTD